LHLGKRGTPSRPILIKSQVQGGAVIDGQNALDRNQAILLDGSYNIIDGFEIRNGPKGGISVWGNNNTIRCNEIHDNGHQAITGTNGQDGVYEDNVSGNSYIGNYIHDNGRPGSNLDHGLYLCGDNTLVINNVSIRNASDGLQISGDYTASNMEVYNNVFAWNGHDGIILWETMNGIDIRNNICINNGGYGICFSGATGSGVVMDYNSLYGNPEGDYSSFTLNGSTVTYTLGTTISSDPMLANETQSAFDAHLTAGSPAIGAGPNLSSTFTTDITGAARPGSGAWDLGAYFYGSSSRPAPPTVKMTAPENDTTVSGSSVPISAIASSSLGIASVQFKLDGADLGSALTAAPYAGIWDSTAVANGPHTLTAVATDMSGSQTTATAVSKAVSVTVNNLQPTVTITAPTNGTTYAAPATVILAASVTPNDHTITAVEFYNGSTLLGLSTSAPYTCAWTNVGAAVYGITAAAVYDSGSTVDSSVLTVTVTNQPVSSDSTNLTFASTSGTISAPFYITNNNAIVQPAYTTLAASGQAVYNINITTAGLYVVTAQVIAPGESYNSFFLNFDVQPTDPTMIWDVPVSPAMTNQTVSWRGNGTTTSNQYVPAVFYLSEGTHQLIVRGREGLTQLGTITIAPYSGQPQYTPPIISSVADQSLVASNPTSALSFTVSDAQAAASNLTVTASSSDQTLVPDTNIVLGGSDSNRTVTVTPASDQLGTATVTLTVSDGTLNSSASFTVTVNPAPVSVTFASTSGTISAPFYITNDNAIVQPDYTTLAVSGQAVYNFTITTAGSYVVTADVIAPGESYNSFFLNIDAQPTDPTMIWDVPVSTTMTSQTVSWRGSGTTTSDQFAPKVFNLSAGAHQLIVRGREGLTQLGTITIAPTNLPAN
jgi:hypothetical protein